MRWSKGERERERALGRANLQGASRGYLEWEETPSQTSAEEESRWTEQVSSLTHAVMLTLTLNALTEG